MPTNLPPDYYEIEKRFRTAESTAEKIGLLEEMYSVVPKHKGTDHLRADLRRQLSRLKDDARREKKKHGGQQAVYHIDKEGAGQVVLVGATNTGKSTLLKTLTNAEPEISAAPFTTWKPLPGMMTFENVQIQLVDTPPMDQVYMEPGLFDLVRRSDLIVILVDLQSDVIGQLEHTLLVLLSHRICPLGQQVAHDNSAKVVLKPLIVLANKCDNSALEGDCEALIELIGSSPEILPVSALTGKNLDQFKRRVFESLGVVRVYARPPGEEPDLDKPFVMKFGGTVEELARKIHKDIAENLKSARVWGSSAFDGQMVSREYVLQDGDVVELRA